jgi:glycosyltransferase involved in cell wall biosynthesis
MNSCLVSIITPAYNAERYLPDAVASVLDQSYTDWELIIINDGSTDGTSDYLSTLIDPRIRVINQSNAGVGVARNAGLEAAQ